MLRDEGPLVPLAGCTDIYVNLNFGTLPPKRFLDLWPLDELRRIEIRGGLLSIGALATYTEMIRSPSRSQAAPDPRRGGARGRGRADPEPRDARGQHRQRFAGRRHVCRSSRSRRRCWCSRAPEGRGGSRSTPSTRAIARACSAPTSSSSRSRSRRSTGASGSARSERARRRRSPRSSWRRSAPARPRIALGSVAPTVVRLPQTEAAWQPDAPSPRHARLSTREIQPIDDLRSTAEYRRRVSGNLLEQFWKETA